MKFDMRVVCLLVLVCLLQFIASPIRGDMIFAGTNEIGISGILDVNTIDGTFLEVDGTWGRYIRDYWEVGIIGGVARSDSLRKFRGGVFTDYIFDLGGPVIPFIGFSLNLFAADVDFKRFNGPSGSEIAYGPGFSMGLMGFLSREVALSFGLELNWASQDVFLTEDTVEDSDIRFKLGLRYFF
jgi:hypothetical protein